jgi:molybdopterin-guanine dinucleotide biosynthesis protein A
VADSISYDAVVLAGGTAGRLGGVDKPALTVGDRTLLDRVLDAVPDALRTVVVGPTRTTDRAVVWCREEPPSGGPVAAIAAGLELVTAPVVVVLAGDLPFLTTTTVHALLEAKADRDGALLVDETGRDQLLVSAWRTDALRAALPGTPAGARLGAVLAGLDAARVTIRLDPGAPPPWFDCDTEQDLASARGAR